MPSVSRPVPTNGALLSLIGNLPLAGTAAARGATLETALQSGGAAWRKELGRSIAALVAIETLVPDSQRNWQPLVREAMQFVLAHLSARRLAAKIVEQVDLPFDTPPEQRLIRLISKMPGLQKLGQVLARNRRLAEPVRQALCELENGMSDVTAGEIHDIIVRELGPRLQAYGVTIEPSVHKEGSASAIVKFTWNKPAREPEQGAFKVLKPYVPEYFAEDMNLLQCLGDHLAAHDRGFGFAVDDLQEMIAEVRLLLEHELDFPREQATLLEAHRMYRCSFGIRVPRLIPPLCTPQVTAMSAENGVKVTEAFPRVPLRHSRIATQVIEALVAVPLLSREPAAVFHADPHAGNLLYDEPNRELVILDWALTDRLTLSARRHLAMLAVMTLLRRPAGVSEAICGLSRGDRRSHRTPRRLIERHVSRFFAEFPAGHSPGVLDAMILLDELAFKGVRFPAALFMFRKVLFTLDGVLHDVTGPGLRMDTVIAYQFLTRFAASFGFFHEPFNIKDLLPVAQALLPG